MKPEDVANVGAAHPLRSYHPFKDLRLPRMPTRHIDPIPLDAVLFKALEKRPAFPVGTQVWIRRRDNGVIEHKEVIGVVMLLTAVTQFHLHYLVAPPKTLPSSKFPGRDVVPWHHAYQSYDDAVRAGDFRPPVDDPIDFDINTAVQYHRNVMRSRLDSVRDHG
jgi:hypothetical protein